MPLERLVFDPATVAAVGLEVDNLRAVADWCQASDSPDRLAKLATRMYGYWWLGAGGLEGRRWLQTALAAEERLGLDERIACHQTVAIASTMNLDNATALTHASRAITLAAGRPGPFAMMALGSRSFAQSVPASLPGADPRLALDARADAHDAVTMASAGMPMAWRASTEFFFAMVETNLGDIDAAARWYESLARSSRQAEATDLLLPVALAGLAVTLHLLRGGCRRRRSNCCATPGDTFASSAYRWPRTTCWAWPRWWSTCAATRSARAGCWRPRAISPGRRTVRSPFAPPRIGRCIATTSHWCARRSVPRRRAARAPKGRR